MRRSTWVGAVTANLALALVLTACNSFKAANQENFTRALNAYYANNDECLYDSALRFPYETGIGDKTPTLDALTGAGLLERSEEKGIKVKRYSLTAFAKNRVSSRFCYGRRQVTSIDSFTPPVTENGQQTAQVQFHYKMADVPGWAQSDPMKSAFPTLAKDTSGQPQASAKLVLTPHGWRVPD